MNDKLLKLMGVHFEDEERRTEEPVTEGPRDVIPIRNPDEDPSDCRSRYFALNTGRDIDQLTYCRQCDVARAKTCSYYKPKFNMEKYVREYKENGGCEE